MIVEFGGASDDVFGYSIVEPNGKRSGGDEHEDSARGTVRAWRVLDPTGAGVLVVGAYNKLLTGVWFVGLAPLDEDVPFPPWAIAGQWRAEGYTTLLRLELPHGSTIAIDSVDGDAVEEEDD